MKITIAILTLNNENTIKNTLKSVNGHEIFIGDLNSQDSTIKISKEYTSNIIKINFDHNLAKAKNQLIKHINKDKILFLEPWELLLEYNDCKFPASVRLINDNFETYPIRLIGKNNIFENRIYESVYCDGYESDIVLYESNKPKSNYEILKIWKEKEPLNNQINYYECFFNLENKEYLLFEQNAKKFLFNCKDENSYLTINYYLALIQIHFLLKIKEGIDNVIKCISIKPEMAEFWCLLGDIHLRINEASKAKRFYENAIILGEKRKRDKMFCEYKKYNLYPLQMIENCNRILNP